MIKNIIIVQDIDFWSLFLNLKNFIIADEIYFSSKVYPKEDLKIVLIKKTILILIFLFFKKKNKKN